LTFELDISPELLDKELFIDKRAILRAINNLLVNAVHYSNKKLSVAFLIQESRYVLSVEDDGPGIPKSEWENVFLPFKQLGNEQRETSKGHGLGLAIVKQIMEWHKGSVVLDKSDLGGARFEISWPIE